MNSFEKKIIGHKVSKVIYSEVNDHNSEFYFDGFDSFDHSINIQMENGFWWNLGWKSQEYFELGQGHFTGNKHIPKNEIKSWDATGRWNKILNSKVSDVKLYYIDEANHIIHKIKIKFENKEVLNIIIAQDLENNGRISYPLEYDFGGVIYVFHKQELITEQKTTANNGYN